MAFDATYLTNTLSQMRLHGQRGLVGGTWSPGPEGSRNAFCSMEDEDVDVTGIVKSSTMLEFLCWCPTSRRKCPLSVCSLPVEHNFAGAGAGQRGNFYMLEVVGQVMSKNGGGVKALVFDAHGTHQHIRRVLHGQVGNIPASDLKAIPFFGELSYEDLPQTSLPRLPIKVAKHGGEIVYGIPGVCDWVSGFQNLCD